MAPYIILEYEVDPKVLQEEVITTTLPSDNVNPVGTSGYLASGTKKTKQLTTQAAKKITPSTSSQTAVASGVYTTGAVTVSAVPTETKTVVPTSSSQTISPSSGKFLSKITLNAADMSSIDITNGVIEEYCASTEDISAGTFVEFVNGGLPTTFGTDTTIDTNQYSGYSIEAVKLSENRVLILYGYNTNTTTKYQYLYGVVCTISGTTITKGTNTAISTASYTAYRMSAVALSENKVCIAHSSSNSYDLAVTALTISGDTITAGTTYTILSTESVGTHEFNITKLSESKVFISYALDSYYYLYGIVCTISGTTVSPGTAVKVSSRTYAGMTNYVVTLTEDKVLILHNYSNSSHYLYGMVCTISGTTITAGTSTSLVSSSYASSNINAIALDENNVFVAHSYDGQYTAKLYGSTVSISGTTPALGSSVQLSSNSYSSKTISMTRVTDNIIFIAHTQTSTTYYLDYTVVQVDGSTITSLQHDVLIESQNAGGNGADNEYEPSAVLISDDIIVVAHNTASTLSVNALVVKLTEASIKSATNSNNIYGITRTNATTTTPGEVWVLQ